MRSTLYFRRSDQILQPETILWLEGDGNYTRIYRQDQQPLLMAYTLKRFEKRFDYFLRIRRNVLVNPQHIRDVHRSWPCKLTISLTDGTILTASRRKQQELISQLRQKLKPAAEFTLHVNMKVQ